jgi:hypothetical protein
MSPKRLAISLAAIFWSPSVLFSASTYNWVAYPAGDISFADQVALYEPLWNLGVPGGNSTTLQSASTFNDPLVALGPPDVDGVLAGHFVGIGHGGRLTLCFTDNVLVPDGTPAADLHISEEGTTAEGMSVEVSSNGSEWTSLGTLGNTLHDLNIDLDSFGLPTTARYRYVRITDDGVITSTSNSRGVDIDAVGAISSLPVIPPPDLSVPLVNSGDTWSILDFGFAPAADWKLPTFIEPTGATGWHSGAGSFGYRVETSGASTTYSRFVNTGAEATTLLNYSPGNNQPAAKYITTYFRKTFELTSTEYSAIHLGARWDDGMVVYINGVEVRRENMPAGAITNQTLATASIGVVAPMSVTNHSFTDGNLNPFVVGTNIIAVELHQGAASSSDVFMDLALRATPAQPNFGEATVGAVQRFDDNLSLGKAGAGGNHSSYLREGGYNQMQYDVSYSAIDSAQGTPNRPELVPSPLIPNSRQLQFQRNTAYTLLSERVDARNFTGIQAALQLRALGDPAFPWGADDYLKGSIISSVDGIHFTEIPWFTYSDRGTSTDIVLIPETQANFWQVPTIRVSPTNATTNPTDWFAFRPSLWADFRTPPGTAFPPNSWRAGNLPTTALKGGIGYDNNTIPINFNPFLDAGSSAMVRADMITKETRVNLRIPFSLDTNPSYLDKVELALRFDDAVGAWLASNRNVNSFAGVKLISDEEPATDNAIPAARDDALAITPKIYDITSIFKANVMPGLNNVLCLRGYNAGLTSIDLLLTAKVTITAKLPSSSSLNSLESVATASVTTPVGLIPEGTQTFRIKLEGRLTGASNLADRRYFYIDDLVTTGTPISPQGLTGMLARSLPSPAFTAAQRLPSADADGDGIPNLLEYAFGSHPGVAGRTTQAGAAETSVTPTASLNPAGRLILKFFALASPLNASPFDLDGKFTINDISYIPETSNDGIAWSQGQFDFVAAVDQANGTQLVTIVTKATVGEGSRKFCRIKVVTNSEPLLSAPGNVTPN